MSFVLYAVNVISIVVFSYATFKVRRLLLLLLLLLLLPMLFLLLLRRRAAAAASAAPSPCHRPGRFTRCWLRNVLAWPSPV